MGDGGTSASSSAASSAKSGNDISLGSDVYNYGTITPASPPSLPGQSQAWLMPAIIGGAVLVAALLFNRK